MLDNEIRRKSIEQKQMFLPDAHEIYSVKVDRSMMPVITVSWTENLQFFADDSSY